MKKAVLFLVACASFVSTAFAGSGLWVNNPQWAGSGKTQGYITEPTMVITPKGVYAEVEFTFRVHCQNIYSATDTLEAVLDFDLPINSFISNSWLWLDENTIIQATIMDKGRAIQIYEGIVKRRRDPSLLFQTGSNSYQLSVFPLTINYPRKVKIVYSVPMYWLTDRANVPLPIDILNTSLVKPSLTLIVKSNNTYTQPFFTEQVYNNFIIATSGNDHVLQIPSTIYQNTDLTLNYYTNLPNGVLLNTYATDNNAGIYQLIVNPVSVLGQAAPKKVVFILDHVNNGSGTVYSFQEVKNALKSYLLNQFNTIDSFNIFYGGINTVEQSFSGWNAADAAGVMSAVNAIPAFTGSNTVIKYEELIKTALAFCKTTPGGDAQVVMISNSNNITSQAIADTTFNRISNFIGGFTNKMHIINNNSQVIWTGISPQFANEALYTKLMLASSGNYYKCSINPGNLSVIKDLDLRNVLREVYRQIGTNISSYSINLPVTSGFTYSRYDINRLNRFSTSVPYMETGKYIGTMQNGNVDIQVLTASGVTSSQLPVSSIEQVTSHSRQGWTHQFLNNLIAINGNNLHTKEIIDSSIVNRVLCSYTAFLALETGDTVLAIVNNSNNPVTLNVPEVSVAELKCYPNPFVSEITIEFMIPVEELMIVDLTGRLVMTFNISKDAKRIVWNGKNSDGGEVAPGIYFIKAKTGKGSSSYKVMKQ